MFFTFVKPRGSDSIFFVSVQKMPIFASVVLFDPSNNLEHSAWKKDYYWSKFVSLCNVCTHGTRHQTHEVLFAFEDESMHEKVDEGLDFHEYTDEYDKAVNMNEEDFEEEEVERIHERLSSPECVFQNENYDKILEDEEENKYIVVCTRKKPTDRSSEGYAETESEEEETDSDENV